MIKFKEIKTENNEPKHIEWWFIQMMILDGDDILFDIKEKLLMKKQTIRLKPNFNLDGLSNEKLHTKHLDVVRELCWMMRMLDAVNNNENC